MYYLSFPGLGIEPFHIDKVAFSLFGRNVAWYGILITFGMILAVLFSFWTGKKEGVSSDDIIDLGFTAIVFGVLGARIYYVIFTWDELNYLVTSAVSDGTFMGSITAFLSNFWETFKNCIAIWRGGLAIYGGVIGGLTAGFVYARIKKIYFFKVFDLLGAAVLIGQIVGRWGNFINIEAFGGKTNLPWRMGISFSTDGGETFISEMFVHPTFLYESLWNCIGLVLMFFIYHLGKKFDGQAICTYIIWYGFGRMFIEGLRTDSLMIGPFRVSQLVGLASVVLGSLVMILLILRWKKTLNDAGEYTPIYDRLGESSADEKTEE